MAERQDQVTTKEPRLQSDDPSRLPEYLEQDFGDTNYDVADMKRLGKRQEFKVDSQ